MSEALTKALLPIVRFVSRWRPAFVAYVTLAVTVALPLVVVVTLCKAIRNATIGFMDAWGDGEEFLADIRRLYSKAGWIEVRDRVKKVSR